MATYDTLKAATSARVVYWVEISGIRWCPSDGFITEANKATLFTDAYTPTLTFRPHLMPLAFSHSRSIELLQGAGKTGGLQFSIIDGQANIQGGTSGPWTDGFWSWVFAEQRNGMVTNQLAEDIPLHAGGAGHDWTMASTSGFGAGVYLYSGLETILPGSITPPVLEDVARSQWNSEAVAHKGVPFGSQTLYPYVTNHPTRWEGRIVTLFQTFADQAGVLASSDGTPATARAEAHRIRGIFRDLEFDEDSNTWIIRCDGIETLLKRRICRDLPRARILPRIEVEQAVPDDDHDALIRWSDGANPNSIATVMHLYQEDNNGANWAGYAIRITPQTYTEQEFIEAINVELDDIRTNGVDGTNFLGSIQLELNPQQLIAHYTPDAANLRRCHLDFTEGLPRGFSTQRYWEQIGLVEFERQVTGANCANRDYHAGINRTPQILIPADQNVMVLSLAGGPDDSICTDFTDVVGKKPDEDATIGGFAMIRSSAGDEFVAVVNSDSDWNNVTIQRGRRYYGMEGNKLEHQTVAGDPVILQRVLVMPGPITLNVMQLILSTGLAAYNDDTWDVLPEGYGAAFPNETINAGAATTDGLIDVASFTSFFQEVRAYLRGVRDVFVEPITLLDWLTKRLQFFGGYLTVNNGQIRAQRGVAVPYQLGTTIDTTNTLPGGKRKRRPLQTTINGVAFKTKWDLNREKYLLTLTFLQGHTASGHGDRIVELEDKGVSIEPEQQELLARDILADFGVENPVVSLTVDRALIDLEAGQYGRFTDEGATRTDRNTPPLGLPNRYGWRGSNALRCLVLSARANHKENVVQLDLLLNLRKRGGFSPAAWINSFSGDTPSVGQATLTCASQVFAKTGEQDVAQFTVGDKCKIIQASAPVAGPSESAGHTILSINTSTNQIVIQVNPTFMSGDCIILIHDDYETAGQTTAAQEWCAVGDSSGDIDDGGDPFYEW